MTNQKHAANSYYGPSGLGGHGHGNDQPCAETFAAKKPRLTNKWGFEKTPKEERICGNCQRRGHGCATCKGPLDIYGFIAGCPMCNSTEHILESCDAHGVVIDDEAIGHFVLTKRNGLPPVRYSGDIRKIKGFNGKFSQHRPWTPKFAKTYAKENAYWWADVAILEDPSREPRARDPIWDDDQKWRVLDVEDLRYPLELYPDLDRDEEDEGQRIPQHGVHTSTPFMGPGFTYPGMPHVAIAGSQLSDFSLELLRENAELRLKVMESNVDSRIESSKRQGSEREQEYRQQKKTKTSGYDPHRKDEYEGRYASGYGNRYDGYHSNDGPIRGNTRGHTVDTRSGLGHHNNDRMVIDTESRRRTAHEQGYAREGRFEDGGDGNANEHYNLDGRSEDGDNHTPPTQLNPLEGRMDMSNFKTCFNCGLPGHVIADCNKPCGYCGKLHSGLAVNCNQKKYACKCRPFPGHNVRNCKIPCRSCRDGQSHSAMSCSKTCCMCGKRNDHCGKDCETCFCACRNKYHLPQNCPDMKECRVPGCGKFWEECKDHCKICGFETHKNGQCPYEIVRAWDDLKGIRQTLRCRAGNGTHTVFGFSATGRCVQCTRINEASRAGNLRKNREMVSDEYQDKYRGHRGGGRGGGGTRGR